MKYMLIGLSFLTLTFNAFALSGEEIYLKNSKAIIHITTVTPTIAFYGTGFFIMDSGYIFTNRHVIRPKTEDGQSLEVREIKGTTLNNEYYNIEVVAEHEFADVALLKVEKIKDGDTYLNISKSELKIGEDVFLIGNPEGLRFTITNGILSQTWDNPNTTVIQFSAPVMHGSSGSPVINRDGEVIGIASHIIDEAKKRGGAIIYSKQGYNLGFHSKHLNELLTNLSNNEVVKENTITPNSNITQSLETETKLLDGGDKDLASLIRELKAYTPPSEVRLGSK